jgi:hypothetical protein
LVISPFLAQKTKPASQIILWRRVVEKDSIEVSLLALQSPHARRHMS